ncbi:MAG: AMP-binding protein [Verrucomicrobiota bacterium]
MNLVSLLAGNAAKYPQRPALIDRDRGQDRIVTFAELMQRTGNAAGFLRAQGLQVGDVILVFQPVSIELYEILLGAFHGGMRVMLADPANGASFLTDCCRRMPPAAFIGPPKAQLLRWFVPGLRKIPAAITTGGWFPGTAHWKCAGPVAAMEPVALDAPALITFTSGSTGQPKAAVRTHGFLLAQHRALADSLAFEDGEVDLITLPVFVLANLASGLTSVLGDTDLRHPGKADAVAIGAQCTTHAVTRCSASPAFFEALLGQSDHSLGFQKIFTGGAPVFADLLERLASELPAAAITAIYGSTEAEPMTHFDAKNISAAAPLTAAGGGIPAGHPVSQIDLRILRDSTGRSLLRISDAEFDALVMPHGSAGEIVVSGDHVLAGYLHGEGDEETKIHAHGRVWHRTGDAGWLDETGGLWLLGRCSAKMPDVAGARETLAYPFAIEAAIRARFPHVRTAAVAWQGERVLVFGRGISPADLSAIQKLSRNLGISRVITVPSLPLDKRHNAKIDYPALHRLLASAAAREV